MTATVGTPRTWIEAARNGDPTALAHLYRHYHPTIYRYIRSRINNHHTAEDLAANTFLRAYTNIRTFTWQNRDPAAWFVTIARNLILDHRKNAATQRELLVGEFHENTPATDHASTNPLQTICDTETDRERAATCHRIRLAILALPTDDQREAMLYRHVDGLSIDDTAALMGRAPESVKMLTYRGTRNVAATLRRTAVT